MITKISCGIVVYDEINHLKRLVPHLQKELESLEVEWVFILNHEQPEIRWWIKNWLNENLSAVTCIENPANNLGFARQLILENASQDYVYLTDPDIDVLPGGLIQLIQLAEAEAIIDHQLKNIGFGGTLIYRSNVPFLQNTYDFIYKVAEAIPFSFQIQHHSYLSTVDHIPSCHLLLKRQLALAIGGFSHHFPRVGEDLEFTHRAFNEGYRFVFLPSSRALHFQNMTVGQWLSKIFLFGRVQITVQKIHFKKGLRYYRLLPLFLLILSAGLILTFQNFAFFALLTFSLLLLLSIFQNQFFGFFMTLLAYSCGGFVELVYPTLGLENETELVELRQVQSAQFQKSRT